MRNHPVENLRNTLSRIPQFQGYEEYLEQYVNTCCLSSNQQISTQDFVYILIEGEIENHQPNQLIDQDFKTLAKCTLISLERRQLQILDKMREEQEQHRKIEFFYRYPFFASLSLRQLKYLVSQLEEHQFKYGTLINRKSLCLIKTGAVLLRRRNHQMYKYSYLRAVIGPGDLFGEYLYLDQEPYDSICYSETVTLFIVDILSFDLDMDETIAYLRSKAALRIKKENNLKIDIPVDNSKRLKPRIQIINEIEAHSTKANDLQRQYFRNLHTMESKAFLKFQEIFLKMNQSYSRTKNYFQSKKLPTDKLFYQVFMNNPTSRSPTKSRYIASNNATARQLTTSNNGTARRLTMSGTRQTFQKTLTNDESISFCKQSRFFTRTRCKSFNFEYQYQNE